MIQKNYKYLAESIKSTIRVMKLLPIVIVLQFGFPFNRQSLLRL